jgi:hypothetical protein
LGQHQGREVKETSIAIKPCVKLIRPTDAEDAAITAAALSDLDAQPLTDEQLSKLRPMRLRGRWLADQNESSVAFNCLILTS